MFQMDCNDQKCGMSAILEAPAEFDLRILIPSPPPLWSSLPPPYFYHVPFTSVLRDPHLCLVPLEQSPAHKII